MECVLSLRIGCVCDDCVLCWPRRDAYRCCRTEKIVIAISSWRNVKCNRVFFESFHGKSFIPGWFHFWSSSALDIVAAFSHGLNSFNEL